MINLKDYISKLQKISEEYGDLPLYTADDDEGNGYTAVCYSPSVCYAEETAHRLECIFDSYDRDEAEKDLGRPLIPILMLN